MIKSLLDQTFCKPYAQRAHCVDELVNSSSPRKKIQEKVFWVQFGVLSVL